MKRILLVCVVAVLALGAYASCQKQSGSGDGGKVTAAQLQGDVEPYFLYQHQCPVCGGEPIKQQFKADIDGKRVYFDKQECVQKWKNNTSKYKKKLDQHATDTMTGGGGGGSQ